MGIARSSAPSRTIWTPNGLVAGEVDPVIFRRVYRLIRFRPWPGDFSVTIRVQNRWHPSLRSFIAVCLVKDFHIDPAHRAVLSAIDKAGAVRREFVVVPAKTNIDACDLPGLGIVKCHRLPSRAFKWIVI